MYKTYQVQKGDTLASVASKLGINTETLAELNGLNISAILKLDDHIVVPKSHAPFDKYIVKQGDTIYEIAKKYKIDHFQLERLNGLEDNDYIYPNQELLVPRPNINFYITSEKDTLNKLSTFLKTNPDIIAKQNETIFLVPDQLIIYKN